MFLRNGFPRKTPSYGILDRKFASWESEKLIDQFGFAYRENAIDLVENKDLATQLLDVAQELIDELGALVETIRGQVVFKYRLGSVAVKFNAGVTQIYIDRDLPLLPDYMEKFLGLCMRDAEGSPVRFAGGVPYPRVEIRNDAGLIKRLANDPKIPLTYPLSFETHEKIALLFHLTSEIAQPLASKECKALVVVVYDPHSDLARSENKDRHFDLNEDVVTRAIGLVGDLECVAGTDDDNCLRVRRREGDEQILNYLAEGFGSRKPFHDFVNTASTPAMSLVIDEPSTTGLEFLNSLGIYSQPQRAEKAQQKRSDTAGQQGRTL